MKSSVIESTINEISKKYFHRNEYTDVEIILVDDGLSGQYI